MRALRAHRQHGPEDERDEHRARTANAPARAHSRVHLRVERGRELPNNRRGRDERVPRGDRRRGVVDRRGRRDAPDEDAGLPAERVDRERRELAPGDEDRARGGQGDDAGVVVAEDEVARDGEGLWGA